MWPPNSPDLNPIALQEKVYCQQKFTSVEQLKLAIIEEWRNIGQHFIDRSINEWRQRLQEVVHKQEGHTERFLISIVATW